jgi:hypothetical protein
VQQPVPLSSAIQAALLEGATIRSDAKVQEASQVQFGESLQAPGRNSR